MSNPMEIEVTHLKLVCHKAFYSMREVFLTSYVSNGLKDSVFQELDSISVCWESSRLVKLMKLKHQSDLVKLIKTTSVSCHNHCASFFWIDMKELPTRWPSLFYFCLRDGSQISYRKGCWHRWHVLGVIPSSLRVRHLLKETDGLPTGMLLSSISSSL